MLSDKNSNQAAARPPPRGRSHPGSPRLARRSPASREDKAALTLDPVRGEVGADILRLGGHKILSPINFMQHPKFPNPILIFLTTTTMGIAFDYAPDRPEHIEAILNGLDRYNPETTTIFQDYVTQQCEDRTYDCYANLALLKL